MKLTVLPPAAAAANPAGSLSALDHVELSARRTAGFDALAARAGGDPAWRLKKLREFRRLAALEQLAPRRLRILEASLASDLEVSLHLNCPAPCHPDEQNNLRVLEGVALAIRYPAEAAREALPGTSFCMVIAPPDVWHANVHPARRILCLGQSIPAGTRVTELVLMAYGALTMQSVQIDEFDSVGVMNVEAARWWQANLKLAPLTREPLIP